MSKCSHIYPQNFNEINPTAHLSKNLGILRDQPKLTPSTEENDTDPLQPIKRRRITSLDSPTDRIAMNYRKRIMCRPPIRRMLNNS